MPDREPDRRRLQLTPEPCRHMRKNRSLIVGRLANLKYFEDLVERFIHSIDRFVRRRCEKRQRRQSSGADMSHDDVHWRRF